MRRNVYSADSEATLQQQVCDYLRLRYPWIIFRSDYASGLKLTIGQATRHKRLQSGRAWPDLFVAHPRPLRPYELGKNLGINDAYCGLFIELKRENARVYTKNGHYVSDPHIREQADMLDRLRARGYKAEFARGWEQARKLIDDYLEEESEPLFGDF